MNMLSALPGAHATQAALNAARDTLADAADPGAATCLLLSLLLLKIASDTEAAARDPSGTYGSPKDWPPTAPGAQLLVVPPEARFELLFQQRFTPGNDSRVITALQRLAQCNPAPLAEVFDVLRLHDGYPRDPDRREQALSRLLGRMTVPALDFRSLRGTYRADIGEAVDRLLDRSQPRRNGPTLAHLPAPLAWLMAALTNPGEDDTIGDVACHQGSLLLAASRWARGTHGARRHQLLGQVEDDAAWARARLRLLLHGEDNHAVHPGSPLQHDLLVTPEGTLRPLQVQVCCPPFALGWSPERGLRDTHQRYVYGLPPRQWGHLALLQHMLRAMDPHTGRIALVVPHGVLFRDGEEALIRRGLLDAQLVDAVIGLPDRLFTGSPVATALLVLRARRTDEAVLFVDARRLMPATKRGPKLDHAAAEQVLALYQQRQDMAGVARLVTPHLLALQNSNLSVARYVEPDEATTPTLDALRGQRACLQSRLEVLEQVLDGDLAGLAKAPVKTG